MLLKPLEQWICDECETIIQSPDQGWLEWLHGPGFRDNYGFRIVHSVPFSPGQPDSHCQAYANHGAVNDLPLTSASGPRAMAMLLALLDVGPLHENDYKGPLVRDIREWVELARRLTIPYYEEARTRWSEAREDGYFDAANEVWPYLPQTLEQLIATYGK